MSNGYNHEVISQTPRGDIGFPHEINPRLQEKRNHHHGKRAALRQRGPILIWLSYCVRNLEMHLHVVNILLVRVEGPSGHSSLLSQAEDEAEGQRKHISE